MEATTQTAAQASNTKELAAETLRGDVRDALLRIVRNMETPWSKLSENDQAWRIDAISRTAEKVVRDAVRTVANQGFPHVEVLVSNKGKFAGGSMELTIAAPFSVENATRLSEHGVGSAILVLAEPGEFFGERRIARAQPDQTSFLGDEAEEDDPEGDRAVPEGEREFSRDAPAETVAPRRSRRTARESVAA